MKVNTNVLLELVDLSKIDKTELFKGKFGAIFLIKFEIETFVRVDITMINNFLLKDVELIHFLLVHNESLTSRQSNYFLTVALCHRENLIMLSSIIFFQMNWQYYFFPRFKRVTVEELDLILPSNNERID